jgi:hypothetical protein
MLSPGPHPLDRFAGPSLQRDRGAAFVPLLRREQEDVHAAAPDGALALPPGVDDAAV